MTARSERPAVERGESAGHDHIVVLEGATWADYQRALELRGERAGPRISFLEGQLQFMSPSRHHEVIKSVIACLVEAWWMDRGIDFTAAGAWTLEKKDADRGLEPDECYDFGAVEDPERPDLAIEVVWTSGGISKLEIYRKLGVPEVWIWKKGRISVFEWVAEQYVARERSVRFPELDLRLVERCAEIRPTSRAVQEFRQAVR